MHLMLKIFSFINIFILIIIVEGLILSSKLRNTVLKQNIGWGFNFVNFVGSINQQNSDSWQIFYLSIHKYRVDTYYTFKGLRYDEN